METFLGYFLGCLLAAAIGWGCARLALRSPPRPDFGPAHIALIFAEADRASRACDEALARCDRDPTLENQRAFLAAQKAAGDEFVRAMDLATALLRDPVEFPPEDRRNSHLTGRFP